MLFFPAWYDGKGNAVADISQISYSLCNQREPRHLNEREMTNLPHIWRIDWWKISVA